MSIFANQDVQITYAERVIKETFGDTVSVQNKAKGLRKFGTNTTVGTTLETIAQFQGTVGNETFVTTNLVNSISSSSASDTTQTIVVEGHSIDGSGNLTFVSQEAILNGQTKVTLTTPMARANRMFVKRSGTFGTTPADLVGIVYCYDDTAGITNGVPNTASATKCLIESGFTQTQKCATSISQFDYYLLNNFSAAVGVSGGAADRVECVIEIRDIVNGGAWLPQGRRIELDTTSNGVVEDFDPIIIVPKNHDIRVRAKTNASTAEISASFSGYLAEII